MTEVGIFFGSSKGATKQVARKIQHAFGKDAVLHDVRKSTVADLAPFDLIVFGSPTYEKGKLQEDWYPFLKALKAEGIDLTGKSAAVFALGDQKKYEKSFADALTPLAKKLKKRGAHLIGAWPVEGYSFKASTAVKKGRFLGLVIDEDRQAVLTSERVQAWVAQLKAELSASSEAASSGS
ncbi:flavodoxin [bacterium]|nr:flavodoxin [bacterium]